MIQLKHVLHAGCGWDTLPPWLAVERETRLDINPRCNPDIVGSMADPVDIPDVDGIYCCHSLEHMTRADGRLALKNFHNILVKGGIALIVVPDLEDVKPTEDVVYVANSGPVTGLDMIYGMERLAVDTPAMAHRTGFVAETLRAELKLAAFNMVAVDRIPQFNLFGVGVK